MTKLTRRVSAELPDVTINWTDTNGAIINFTAYTFVLKIGPTTSGAATITKSTGITGAATLPNVTVSFTAAELDSLTPSVTYQCQLMATTAGRQRGFPDFDLYLTPAMT